MVHYCPIDISIAPNIKLLSDQKDPFKDLGRYRRLVGKLNYLTITKPNITFVVSIMIQFLNASSDSHWDAIIPIIKYINNALRKRTIN